MTKIRILLLAFIFSHNIMSQSLFNTEKQAWADSIFSRLTPDEKIGQLFMPRGNYNANYDPELLKFWIKEYKIGGLVMFAGHPVKQAKLINELQALSKVPLIIGMDLEWGLAMRLDSTTRFPFQMTLGAMQGNDDLIYQMGQEIGKQCRRMGVHINYAPVVDVNINPNNPVINFRSFGENKYKVTEKALAYMKGLQSEGIITSAKHFPGHGDTGVDSHYDLPIIPHTKARLDSIELYPYRELIKNGLQGVMIAHLNVPVLDATPNLATTMSKKIVTDLLRKELNFKGLIFTDAMDMKGATKYFPEGTANVKAILAGNDILETLTDIPGAFNAIKYALANKEITQAEIDERVKKILLAKAHAGLWNYKPIVVENLISDLNPTSSDLLNRKLAEKTLTVVKNDKKLLPITALEKEKIATLAIGATGLTQFQKSAELYMAMDHYTIDQTTTTNEVTQIKEKLKNYTKVLISLHSMNTRPANNYSLKPEIASLFNQFATKENAIVTMFCNVLALPKFETAAQIHTLLMPYQETVYTQIAAAEAIFGAKTANGRLPLTVNENFKYNQGQDVQSIGRMSYTIPEAVGLNGAVINAKIDSLVNLAIKEKATPGAVVLVAKDNQVFYHKAFGSHDYSQNKSVKTTDLYDLASITKITTSVPSFMKWQDEGKFSLNSTVGQIAKGWENTNKAELNYLDILTHRARLRAWIPFWMNAIDSVAMAEQSSIFAEKYKKSCMSGFFTRLFNPKKAKANYRNSVISNAKAWTECINLAKTETIWKPKTFANNESENYPIQVADALWMHKDMEKTLFEAIATSPLRDKKEYVYSDLSYYLLPNICKQFTGQSFDSYLKETFYKPLGASTLTFNPRNTYGLDRIVPTEYDSTYRKNLIHGRVHDEGASILNGVSGHAGLFGNANDLAKLMTMYLNKGTYAGRNYLSKETVTEYSSYPFNLATNPRRGVGFDKPDRNKPGLSAAPSASELSFGHSGFTGTYTWVDPKYNLVYVFLSNRVNPTRNNSKLSDMNIRTNILEEVYKQLK